MNLIFKLLIVTLLIYLKLNGLKTLSLIDRHKSSSLSLSSTLKILNNKNYDYHNKNIVIYTTNKINKNLSNKNINSNKSIISTIPEKTIKRTITIKNELTFNPTAEKFKKQTNISQLTDGNHKQQQQRQRLLQPKYISIGYDMDINNNTNTQNHCDCHFGYNYYNFTDSNKPVNIASDNNNNIFSSPSSLRTDENPSFLHKMGQRLEPLSQDRNNSFNINTLQQQSNLRHNNNNSSNSTKFMISKIPSTTNLKASIRKRRLKIENDNVNVYVNNNMNANENVHNFNDNKLQKPYVNSEKIQIKTNFDGDGFSCFLNAIKKSLIWWSNSNGSLNIETILKITKHHSYLDFSYANIAKDDYLYRKTRAHEHFNNQKIIAFSAAKNELISAPYRTLLLLNSTLKYLSLKGNQFSSFEIEPQTDFFDPSVLRINNNNISKTTVTNGTNFGWQTPMPPFNLSEIPKIAWKLNNLFTRFRKYEENNYRKLNSNGEGIAWATFPLMPALTELDISDCKIEFITKRAFQNLTNLRRLYLSHNKILTIPYDVFQHTPLLQYLDLSFTSVLDWRMDIPIQSIEMVYNFIYGLRIDPLTFRYLPELVYLDLSYTKLTRNSAFAFENLNDKLRYMSLCYTAFPVIGIPIFKRTSLIGLDLSGNSYAVNNFIDSTFEEIADTLQYLYFDRSNINNLDWLKYLSNLNVLSLSGNNINSLSSDTFSSLKNLKILDLSSNHIGNWYKRILKENENLRMLSLRNNNINIITSEMLRDFELLDYLSLGNNDFVCNCLLKDLVDIAAENNRDVECLNSLVNDEKEFVTDNGHLIKDNTHPDDNDYDDINISSVANENENGDVKIAYNVLKLLIQERYEQSVQSSVENIKRLKKPKQEKPHLHFLSRYYNIVKRFSPSKQKCSEIFDTWQKHADHINTSLLRFQLLDYEDEHYWCFNETERLHFMQLNCDSKTYVEDLTQLRNLTKYVVSSVCAVIGISMIGVLVYLKRWHIHYYISYLKTAALVSVVAKNSADQFDALAESDPNLVYDIFISYSDGDRQWVIEELLPNIEQSGDVSICMHERDFQIGLTILDNIISCMDRSRALMLIISNNFLLSHWCQFELHLAQHRIFEVSKDHLILVFLEDIPRQKRPKTLQYLMEVKTYIMWPNSHKNADERKFFWKRLKRTLETIGLRPNTHHRVSHA